jgi:hypothetical protein
VGVVVAEGQFLQVAEHSLAQVGKNALPHPGK